MASGRSGHLPIVIHVAEGCKRLLFAEKATRGLDSRDLSRIGKSSSREMEVCLKTANALTPTLR